MFIAALFARAKTWKQLQCPSTNEWMKIWYIYTMEYYSVIKKRESESILVRWVSEVAQSCPTLWDPMHCSLPGFSVYGIFQARVLEWVVISFSRGSSHPRDRIHVSCISWVGRWILYHWATRWFSKCIFNWRIIALQCCAGFCHTSTWISHRYTYVPSLLNLLPTSLSIPPL